MSNSDEPGGVRARRRKTFPRSHRLKRRNLIRSLFDRSRNDVRTVTSGCIRLLSRIVDREQTGFDVPIQVGFAPGRRTSTAVQRNRIRRLLRESYRKHQHILRDLSSLNAQEALILMILFRSDPERHRADIFDDLPHALHLLADRL